MSGSESIDVRDVAPPGTVSRAAWRILPLLGVAYLFAYMDRVNISFAALQMNADLGFSATVYGLGGGLFFLAYALFEVPSNLFLTRIGARRWIARIMITWGMLAAAMMFVHTAWQFYLIRFLLGAAEAGFFPGIVYYLAHWFPRDVRGRALSVIYILGALAGVVIGALSPLLLSLDGSRGLQGWQWLFLVEGLPAVLVGLSICCSCRIRRRASAGSAPTNGHGSPGHWPMTAKRTGRPTDARSWPRCATRK